jgi:hypothetical protein
MDLSRETVLPLRVAAVWVGLDPGRLREHVGRGDLAAARLPCGWVTSAAAVRDLRGRLREAVRPSPDGVPPPREP